MSISDTTELLLHGMKTLYYGGLYSRLHAGWGDKDITVPFDRFYLLLSGQYYFRINGTVIHGKPRDVIFLPRNTVQTYHAYQDPTASHMWFHCLYDCDSRPLFDVLRLPLQACPENTAHIQSLFTQINAPIPDLGGMIRRRAAMLELLACYIAACPDISAKPWKNDRQNEILDYINEHLCEPLTTADLADHFGYSESYFIRTFKSALGITPMDYVINRRLELARERLRFTDVSITDVAAACGFAENANYFARVFKARTGSTPTQYRTMYRNLRTGGEE